MSSNEAIQTINVSHKNAECFNEKGSKDWELVASNKITELYDDG